MAHLLLYTEKCGYTLPDFYFLQACITGKKQIRQLIKWVLIIIECMILTVSLLTSFLPDQRLEFIEGGSGISGAGNGMIGSFIVKGGYLQQLILNTKSLHPTILK